MACALTTPGLHGDSVGRPEPPRPAPGRPRGHWQAPGTDIVGSCFLVAGRFCIVQALRDAAHSPWCGTANIGGGSRRSLNDAVEIVGELLGHVRILRRPEAAGGARDTAADTSVAAAAFGYRPQTSLRDGLAAMVATERVSEETLR